MNKKQVVDIIVNECGISRFQVKLILEMIFSEIVMLLKLGNTVKLVGFGIFKIKNLQERSGYNPYTGKKVIISSSKIPVFIFSKSFKKVVNQ